MVEQAQLAAPIGVALMLDVFILSIKCMLCSTPWIVGAMQLGLSKDCGGSSAQEMAGAHLLKRPLLVRNHYNLGGIEASLQPQLGTTRKIRLKGRACTNACSVDVIGKQ